MKIVTDYKPATPASKYDADAAEFINAAQSNPDVIGAIEVSVLAAKDDADAETIIGRETRAFQAAILKQGYSARRRETRDNGDGSFDVLFSVTRHTPRKPRGEATPTLAPAPELVEESVTETAPTGKSKK